MEKIIWLGGAADGITGSCAAALYKKRWYLLDYGAKFENGTVTLPDIPEEVWRGLALVLVSHAHVDHSGGLPHLAARMRKEGRKIPFLMTNATYHLAVAMMEMSIIHQNGRNVVYEEQDIAYFKKYAMRIDGSVAKPALAVEDLRIVPKYAGHMRGAVSYLFKTPEKTVLFTMDMSLHDQATVSGAEIPAQETFDAIFIEATNGKEDAPDREAEKKNMAEKISATIAMGGNVLIPSSSNWKGAEMVFWLLKHGFTVHVDGAIRNLIKKVLENPRDYTWCERDVFPAQTVTGEPINTAEKILYVEDWSAREALFASHGAIVVTTSQDMNAGYSPHYFYRWIQSDRADNIVIVVGNQHEETSSEFLSRIFAEEDGPTAEKSIAVKTFAKKMDDGDWKRTVTILKSNDEVAAHMRQLQRPIQNAPRYGNRFAISIEGLFLSDAAVAGEAETLLALAERQDEKAATHEVEFSEVRIAKRQVLQIYLSGHSSREDSISYLKALMPKKVFLTHSEPEAAAEMKRLVEDRLGIPTELTSTGAEYEI